MGQSTFSNSNNSVDADKGWGQFFLYLVYALLLSLISYFAQAFHQENEGPRTFVRWGFAVGSLYFVFVAGVHLSGRLKSADSHPIIWWLGVAIFLPLAIGHILLFNLIPFGLSALISYQLCTQLILGELIGLIGITYYCRKRSRTTFPIIRHYIGIVSLLNVLLYPLLLLLLFKPPTQDTCSAFLQKGVVEKITSHDFVEAFSHPYRALFIPEKELLAVPFKMASNLSFPFWNPVNANQLVVMRVTGSPPYESAVLPLSGESMPENIAYNPTFQEVIVTRNGPSSKEHYIELIDISKFPTLSLVHRFPFPGGKTPDDIVVFPGGQFFAVYSVDCVEYVFDREKLRLVQSRKIIKGWCEHAYQQPGSPLVYLSLVGDTVVERNILLNKTRTADVFFGSADLLAVSETGLLYQNDVLFRAINVINLDTMILEKRQSLQYSVRAIAADPKRDLLMVGETLSARLHVLRLSDLTEIPHPPIYMGSFLRYFAYDQKRGRLFGTSKCGVYEVNIEALIKSVEMD